MEQTIPTKPVHVYKAGARFDQMQVNRGDTPTFPIEVDLGFGIDTITTCAVRGIVIAPDKRMEFSKKLHELLDNAELLVEEISSPGDDVPDGVECDVWFKPPGAPQFLSLANSLVSCGVARTK